ncbi:ImmA/IrrE family metallo-endopeptidase [Histidinibacterium aquaticum]|uniref:ImmA/IrrE family metallo-endopeptidase n=1 Tax=Histidinibacterium aquaticum TaxID=2613962 RepID=A0A5J5GQ16_9RHOB|nr:XRE family transcriptional regulator [Histidinibacterium aquaticum]KAA9010155.1 ImmA/IrrE family metallo-endopeptidase [Histidinibacterium aquaticum]
MAAASAKLPINPQVLAWARVRAGIEVEDAAAKAGVRPSRVVDWEQGDDSPTPRQARILAKHYHRPFLEFFANEVPDLPEVSLVPDFRFHRKPAGPAETHSLQQVQSWAEEQRLNAFDLFDLLGEAPAPFPEKLYSKLSDDVEDASIRVRDFLGFSPDEQTSLPRSEKYKLPNIVRTYFSSCNVLVLKYSSLGRLRTRGLCLYAEPLPIIVYGNEAPGAQAFTLAHEFAHIILRQSAISSYPRFGRTGNLNKKVEGWCNRFAAAFLMPASEVLRFLSVPESPHHEISDDTISEMASLFGVSRQAMLIRLVALNYVEAEYYWRIKRPQFIEEEEGYEPPPARSPYYGSRYKSKLGDYYTGLVMEAWAAGAISAHNAAEFMGIKNFRHLEDIRRDVSS